MELLWHSLLLIGMKEIGRNGGIHMKTKVIKAKGTDIAVVNSDKVCVSDGQTALDFMMSVNHETGCHSIVINKEAIVGAPSVRKVPQVRFVSKVK